MGKRKKHRTHVEDPEESKGIPKSFVFRRGEVSRDIADLTENVRKVMQPNTALHLQESNKNQLKDFLHVATPLGVTHFLIFTQTVVGTNLRVIRIPRGPTLTFRVQNYSLMKDVVALQKRPHSPGAEFEHSPLIVLNNFSGPEDEKQIMTAMFQNMFPAIEVQRIKLSDCRRVVLFSFDTSSGLIHFRHYVINASPVGLTKVLSSFLVISDLISRPSKRSLRRNSRIFMT